MKKLNAILLVLIYTTLSVVGSFSFHYCHNQLVDFAINKPAKSCCGENEEIKSDCCKSISIVIDLEEDQRTENNSTIINNYSVTEICTGILHVDITKEHSLSNSLIVKYPPGKVYQKAYRIQSSFLFYS